MSNEKKKKKKMKNFAHHNYSSMMAGMGPIPILSTTVLSDR